MGSKNYYDTLGIKLTATQQEIKQAYRKLSIKFHPDKNEGDHFFEELFKEINAANEILSDPVKRKEYDNTLGNPKTSHSRQSARYDDNHTPYNQRESDIEKIFEFLELYYKKESIVEEKGKILNDIKYKSRPKNLTVVGVLFMVLLLIGLFWVTRQIPDVPRQGARDQSISVSYEWTTVENVSVYARPDISSPIISYVPSGKGFNGLRETRYFIKVNFEDTNGNNKKGYILKEKMMHKITVD